MTEQTLTPQSPVDLALRQIARQAEARAEALDPQDAMQTMMRYIGDTATRLARLARKIPPTAGLTALHLGLALVVAQEPRPTDSPARQVHRLICQGMMAILQEAGGVAQGTHHDAAKSAHLWGLLSALLAQEAMPEMRRVEVPGEPPNEAARQQAMGLMAMREMMLIDLLQMTQELVGLLAPQSEAQPVPAPEAAQA